jgi:hypothetical protein
MVMSYFNQSFIRRGPNPVARVGWVEQRDTHRSHSNCWVSLRSTQPTSINQPAMLPPLQYPHASPDADSRCSAHSRAAG